MTYLVMECHPAYAIVLDQTGRMIRVANMGYEEGQKVDEVIEQQSQSTPMRMKFASIAVAACFCAAVLGSGAYGAFFVPYGTVRMKINPDVILSVSYMDRVVDLKGLNEDGSRLIDQISYKGKHAEEMTQLLAERAVDMGYLSDGGTVTVCTEAGSSKWRQRRESDITSGLKQQFAGRMEVEIRAEEDGEAEDNREETGNPATASVSQPVTQPATQSTIQPSQPTNEPEAQPAVQPAAQPAAGQGPAAPDQPAVTEKSVHESEKNSDNTGDDGDRDRNDSKDRDDDIRDDSEDWDDDRDDDDGRDGSDHDDDDDDDREDKDDSKDHHGGRDHNKVWGNGDNRKGEKRDRDEYHDKEDFDQDDD